MEMNRPSMDINTDALSDNSETSIMLLLSTINSQSYVSTNQSSESPREISKSIRNQFFINVKMYDTNWSATCLICNKIQFDKKGVTSNINRHVKTQHKDEYEKWLLELNDFDKKNQTKISDTFSKKSNSKSAYNDVHPRQIQLSKAICMNLIIELGLPLSLVERPAFIDFMHTVDPKFSITSRRTLSRSTIPRLFDNMNEKLKYICADAKFISLTLDIWTDRRMRAFYAMTGHTFIEKSLKSFVLCFIPLHGSHTANLLLHHYENVLNTFDINTKIVRIVTDNASNNIKAFQDLIIPGFEEYFENENEDDASSDIDVDAGDEEDDETEVLFDDESQQKILSLIKTSFDNIAASNESLRLPCFSHSLHLVVSDGLKAASCIKQVLSKVSKIAKLSHTSTIFAEKLESIGKSIPKANKTRWNSQFSMVEKLLRIPSSDLNDILMSIKRQDLCLLTKDYQILNEFSSLLVLLAEATAITQSEKTPSISFIAPTILAIYSDLLSEKENVIFTLPLCEALLSSLIARFGGLLEQLDIEIDKPIKPKNTYDFFKDPLFIYTPCLDGKFKLHWIEESVLPSDKKKLYVKESKIFYMIIVYQFDIVNVHNQEQQQQMMNNQHQLHRQDQVQKEKVSSRTLKTKIRRNRKSNILDL